METIGFIGAGNMAEAILQGIVNAKIYTPESIYISDLRAERLQELADRYGVTALADNGAVAARCDMIILCVKPKTFVEALQSIKDQIPSDTTVVSIVAGKQIKEIADILGDRPIVRVMPNTPCLVNEGASGVFANDRGVPRMERVTTLFQCVGKTVVVDNEACIDAVTAASGSGPAYYFLLMESMIDAARSLGLSDDTARTLVLQTAKGAALLAEQGAQRGESPTELRRKVTTPGGTTEAAITAFQEGGFAELVEKALTAACTRSRELSR